MELRVNNLNTFLHYAEISHGIVQNKTQALVHRQVPMKYMGLYEYRKYILRHAAYVTPLTLLHSVQYTNNTTCENYPKTKPGKQDIQIIFQGIDASVIASPFPIYGSYAGK